MQITRHLILMIASEIVGFLLAGGLAFWWFWTADNRDGFQFLIRMALPFIVVKVVVNVLFRYLIPARCPEPNCGGSCFPKGTKPITYRCRGCGYEHETKVSVTSGGQDHHDTFHGHE